MKFALSSYGTRGEVEPCVAVGRELQLRGHEVTMAVPPDLVGFVEAAGLGAVAFALDSQTLIEPYVRYWTTFYRNRWNLSELATLSRRGQEVGSRALADTSATLTSLASDSDLLLTGVNFEIPAANVAEYYDIPLATMHFSPIRANSHIVPVVPPPLGRSLMTMREWFMWLIGSKKPEDAQRRELGLPNARSPLPRRIAEHGSLEIQAYDEACFPGLAEEWARSARRRPFVGTLTIEMPTDADEEIQSWIAAGSPPICFGFGSMLVESVADTVAMIAGACAELGERALVCAGVSELSEIPRFDNVKVVSGANYATIFPACRAVVHHGTSATAAGLRAGVPTLVLWKIPEQRLWGNTLKRLRVGTARCFSATTRDSLVEDLRTILTSQCAIRASEIASRMTKPAESASHAADLVEKLARHGHVR